MILKILVGVNYCAACFRGHCFSMEGGRRQDGGGGDSIVFQVLLNPVHVHVSEAQSVSHSTASRYKRKVKSE